jgi:hypothetical protein
LPEIFTIQDVETRKVSGSWIMSVRLCSTAGWCRAGGSGNPIMSWGQPAHLGGHIFLNIRSLRR